MTRRLAAASALLGGAAAAMLLAGCSPTVHASPARHAAAPACAAVTVRLPAEVAGLGRRDTDARSTGAWGDPERVLLTCGVTVPRVSSLPCITVDGVYWLRDQPSDALTIYTTYGRDPAIDVAIGAPAKGMAAVSDGVVLSDLARAVKRTPTSGLVCR